MMIMHVHSCRQELTIYAIALHDYCRNLAILDCAEQCVL